jgi:2-polyprenyl-3-methyl-5-hydroxy-6-metoxy-1,4-benzoquinol methylase
VSESIPEADAFYTNLFCANAEWSSPYPNLDEVHRLQAILEYATVARMQAPPGHPFRIVDVGCGRGWLTNLLSAYGDVEGVDPVPSVIEGARLRYPGLRFHIGGADTLLAAAYAETIDLVVATEVIEHVERDEQPKFVEALCQLTRPGGHVIVTTPRGEYHEKAGGLGYLNQPTECWLTESQLRRLFEDAGLAVKLHGRVHPGLPRLSRWHRIAASRRGARWASRMRATWILEGLRKDLGFYQTWLFQKESA